MQIPSHFLMTAFINDKLKLRFLPVHTGAFLFGSVLPDLPFTLLTVGGEIYYRWFAPLPVETGSIMEYLHFTLFFTDPVWIVSHNFFHSLIINSLLLGLGYGAMRQQYKWGVYLFWLAVGTQLHTIIDIFTHSSDGPLLFFPLNWTYRFASPISYWETDNYGRWFILFEYLLDGVIIGYFLTRWFERKRSEQKAG